MDIRNVAAIIKLKEKVDCAIKKIMHSYLFTS